MDILKNYFPIAEAISSLLYPHAEVVIHDLRTGKIAAIFNNFSKRKVGDPSLLEELKKSKEVPDPFPIYFKVNWDGRRLKSSSAVLRNDQGEVIGLLCTNVDLTPLEQMDQFLQTWLSTEKMGRLPDKLFKDDWREKINRFVTAYVRKEGITLKTLTKEQKQKLITLLEKEGAFEAKHAASYAAEVIGVSRATIYNYLRENR